jgi:ferritin-like metal-binding protein YciE
MARKDTSKKTASNALEELFLHALGDIYSAEKAASKALTELAGAATLPGLQVALTAHRDETEAQKVRIEKVFEIFDAKPQAIEHYEINRFGALREWAQELGKPDAARLLSEMLDAEYSADQMLTKIAEDQANPVADGRRAGM